MLSNAQVTLIIGFGFIIALVLIGGLVSAANKYAGGTHEMNDYTDDDEYGYSAEDVRELAGDLVWQYRAGWEDAREFFYPTQVISLPADPAMEQKLKDAFAKHSDDAEGIANGEG